MFSIGEFSRATQLTVKTLRFYHDQGILIPARIDPVSGYRYYDSNSYHRAQQIEQLKNLGFTITEIYRILTDFDDEQELTNLIKEKLIQTQTEINKLKALERNLKQAVSLTAQTEPVSADGEILETDLELPLLAIKEITGRYENLGEAYRNLYTSLGAVIKGKPFALYYDLDHREKDLTMEAAIPIKKEIPVKGVKGITYRQPETIHCIKTEYSGPYGRQGNTYLRLFAFCRERGLQIETPVIEHYIKGPGMILRGNPEKYRTECILKVTAPGQSEH